MSHRRSARLYLACALLLSGCARPAASTIDRPRLLLTDRSPPAGRTCRPAPEPAALPTAGTVVDSVRLLAGLAALRQATTAEQGFALLSLSFDQNGWNARREVIEHNLTPEMADSVQSLVFQTRRQVAPGGSWGVRLRLDLGRTPRLAVGRQEFCEPRQLNATGISIPEHRLLPRTSSDPALSRPNIWVRVLVDERGLVREAQVEPSGTGLRGQVALRQLALALSFLPALLDGEPVESWTRVPVTLQ